MNKSNDKLHKFNKFMERFWLAIAIATLLVVIYFFIVEGVNRVTIQYLVFPAIAGAMYGFRYSFRKRMEARNNC